MENLIETVKEILNKKLEKRFVERDMRRFANEVVYKYVEYGYNNGDDDSKVIEKRKDIDKIANFLQKPFTKVANAIEKKLSATELDKLEGIKLGRVYAHPDSEICFLVYFKDKNVDKKLANKIDKVIRSALGETKFRDDFFSLNLKARVYSQNLKLNFDYWKEQINKGESTLSYVVIKYDWLYILNS